MPQNRIPIRLGIVGCGKGTSVHHLPALARIPQFKVLAVADVNAACLNRMADQYRVPQRFEDYRRMLCEADIDAVAVVTPTATHAEIGLAALDMGKHLFMEKPLALNMGECDSLIAASARIPCKAMVDLNNRWHRLALRAREIVRSGMLGNLKAIRSVYTHWHPHSKAPGWHGKRISGGGVLFNDGGHHFDLWRFLLDAEVNEIFAHSISSGQFEDDTCTVSATLSNGMLANAVFSFSTSPTSELEIFGDAGRLLLSLYRFDGLEFFSNASYPGSIRTRLQSAAHTFREAGGALAGLRSGGDFTSSYDALWRHYADCIQRDITPACTLEDGSKALQITLAALRSCQSGTPVQVKDIA